MHTEHTWMVMGSSFIECIMHTKLLLWELLTTTYSNCWKLFNHTADYSNCSRKKDFRENLRRGRECSVLVTWFHWPHFAWPLQWLCISCNVAFALNFGLGLLTMEDLQVRWQCLHMRLLLSKCTLFHPKIGLPSDHQALELRKDLVPGMELLGWYDKGYICTTLIWISDRDHPVSSDVNSCTLNSVLFLQM